ncbi:MAG: T9SS type A sorting domain-containing protein [Bacteroidetes bacterium]|nr:T9SS type A sorting domain-containing protein [Bacteroidota bacterium]
MNIFVKYWSVMFFAVGILFVQQHSAAQAWTVQIETPMRGWTLGDLVVNDIGNVYVTGYGFTDDSVTVHGTFSSKRGGPNLDECERCWHGSPSHSYLISIDHAGEPDWIRGIHKSLIPEPRRPEAIGMGLATGIRGPVGITGLNDDAIYYDSIVPYKQFCGGGISVTSYSLDGVPEWSQTISSSIDSLFEDRYALNGCITGLDTDAEGNVYLTGLFADTLFAGPHMLMSPNERVVFLAKYSADGELLWTRSIGGNAYMYSPIYLLYEQRRLQTDSEGNIYLLALFRAGATFAGATSDTLVLSANAQVLVSLTTDGDVRWFDVQDYKNYTNESHFYLGEDPDQLFVQRTHAPSWHQYGRTTQTAQVHRQRGYSIFGNPTYSITDILRPLPGRTGYGGTVDHFLVDPDGAVYVAGRFWHTIHTTDFRLDSSDLPPGGIHHPTDAFVAYYDPNGEFVTAEHFGGPGNQVILDMDINPSGGLLISGFFTEDYMHMTKYTPPPICLACKHEGQDSAYLTSDTLFADRGRTFIINYDGVGSLDIVEEEYLPSRAELLTHYSNFPNPFSNRTDLSFRIQRSALVEIDIFNITGRRVHAIERHFIPGKHAISVDGSSLASGIYYYRITALGQSQTGKMVLVR